MFLEFKTHNIKTLIEAIVLDRDRKYNPVSLFCHIFPHKFCKPQNLYIKFDSEYQFGTDFSDASCELSYETLPVKFCRFPQKQIYIFVDNIPRKLKSP